MEKGAFARRHPGKQERKTDTNGKEERNVKIFLLCIFLWGAGWTDLCSGKVRNTWILFGIVSGLLCRKGAFFLPAFVVLIPAFALFHMRMMGAGDGKMMAVVAGYLGLDQGLKAIGLGMAVGAAWSLYRFRYGKNSWEHFRDLTAYFRRMIQTKRIEAYQELSLTACRNTIPLAACLACGVYLYLLGTCAGRVMGGIG